jgi:chemotaxis protein methyltransferase CheR
MSVVQRVTPIESDRISKRNFERLADFIYTYSGIKMPPTKATMLEGRLRRRLRATGLPTFDTYCNFLFSGGLESEAVFLIDAVTTNKTDFFREPNHFDFLADHAIPSLLNRGESDIRAWSAACSTGAEPYTIAMVLDESLAQVPRAKFAVLATDLSTEVLATAQRGIYTAETVAPVPPDMMKRYVRKAVDKRRQEVRIAPQLRSRIGFARLNLMDQTYPVGNPMHLIFCRNVMIYFDKPTQLGVLTRLCKCLAPGGYLFIGHSESVAGFNLPLKQVANTVFQHS